MCLSTTRNRRSPNRSCHNDDGLAHLIHPDYDPPSYEGAYDGHET